MGPRGRGIPWSFLDASSDEWISGNVFVVQKRQLTAGQFPSSLQPCSASESLSIVWEVDGQGPRLVLEAPSFA